MQNPSSHQRPPAGPSIGGSLGGSIDPTVAFQQIFSQQNPHSFMLPTVPSLLSSASQPQAYMVQQPFMVPRPQLFPLSTFQIPGIGNAASMNAQQQVYIGPGGQLLIGPQAGQVTHLCAFVSVALGY